MGFSSLARKAEMQGELNGVETKDNYDFYMVAIEVIVIDIFFHLYEKYAVLSNLKICDAQRELYQRMGPLFFCVLSKVFGHREIDPLFQGKKKDVVHSDVPCVVKKEEIPPGFNTNILFINSLYSGTFDIDVLEEIRHTFGFDPIAIWIILTCFPQDRRNNDRTIIIDTGLIYSRLNPLYKIARKECVWVNDGITYKFGGLNSTFDFLSIK